MNVELLYLKITPIVVATVNVKYMHTAGENMTRKGLGQWVHVFGAGIISPVMILFPKKKMKEKDKKKYIWRLESSKL